MQLKNLNYLKRDEKRIKGIYLLILKSMLFFSRNIVRPLIIMARRFLNFVNAIRTSSKHALRSRLRVVKYDTLSVTGRNLKSILLQTEVQDVRKLKACDYKIKYRNIPRNEKYYFSSREI